MTCLPCSRRRYPGLMRSHARPIPGDRAIRLRHFQGHRDNDRPDLRPKSRKCNRQSRTNRTGPAARADTQARSRPSLKGGAFPNALACLGQNIPVGNSARLAAGQCRAESLEPGPIFPLCLLQRPQPGTQHFAGIGVLAAADFGVYELIQMGGQIDVAGGHRASINLVINAMRIGKNWQRDYAWRKISARVRPVRVCSGASPEEFPLPRGWCPEEEATR